MFKPMLAVSYEGRLPRSGAWIVEPKLDGIRCVWDGESLWKRKDKGAPVRVSNPPAVLADLLDCWRGVTLDGEICGATFGETLSVVQSQQSVESSSVKFHVFDLLGMAGQGLCAQPLDKRLNLLETLWDERGPFEALQFVPYRPLAGRDPIVVAQEMVAAGFEGAMLKRLGSPYLAGTEKAIRSAEWLKVKLTRSEEGVIVGAEPGEGRLASSLGTLIIEASSGERFRVGSGRSFTDAVRAELWAAYQQGGLLGRRAVFQLQEDSSGIGSRFPKFVEVTK